MTTLFRNKTDMLVGYHDEIGHKRKVNKQCNRKDKLLMLIEDNLENMCLFTQIIKTISSNDFFTLDLIKNQIRATVPTISFPQYFLDE